jgi:glycosyltransferase involved in cell wall biosynthesis
VSTTPASGGLDELVLAEPAGDADALARAVVRAGREPALRERLRRGAAELAAQRAWFHIADQHVAIYTSLSVR